MLEMWEDGSEYCTAIVNGTASTFGIRSGAQDGNLLYLLYYLDILIILKLPFSFAWS